MELSSIPVPKLAQVEIGGVVVDVLNVPFIQQPPQMLCFPYSVSMVIEFFRQTETGVNIPSLTLGDLIRALNTDPERGTVLSKTTIKKLNEVTYPIEFAIYHGNLGKLDECFEKRIPPILIFNSMYYIYSMEGPAHATVYVGRTETKIITNNPWMGKSYPYDLERFLEAWEVEGNKMVIARLRKEKRIEDARLNKYVDLFGGEE
ncbi:hypothetical protein Arcpr_1764 [Archaeoglobus profundus DSM 5631]|uniref:Peptidase C39-like domain-containing protein n=1 Tax=Archaeoglobus profundus (strain DSM 5631 / JCM 9629 / NBRC 100127 / Av18) TaxID=572546 RepID=D2RFB4_ARCPA|nr:hypothetical protein Arcpr_1764 [Archaeoglobus profundus DSM 5631]